MTLLYMLTIPLLACWGVYGEVSSQYKQLILDKHNEYRRQQGGSNMFKLVWNDTNANAADSWMASCNMAHQMTNWGENLFFKTMVAESDYADAITEAMKNWYDEISMYYYGSYSCGASCHYTQMVWHASTQIGCAHRACPYFNMGGMNYQNAFYFGCWYFPKGNMMGEDPYAVGSGCGDCGGSAGCDQGLCTA